MKPNSKIFCNSPWFELHIYWDGGLGVCCQESQRLYADNDRHRYNIMTMTLGEWYNSEPVKNMRLAMFNNTALPTCSVCYKEESVTNTSRRHKCNQKSVIFTRTAFDQSLQQSPNRHQFRYSFDFDGKTITQPVDLHVNLGNYCNLACKMCAPQASSRIAVQHVKWGLMGDSKYVGTDWTKNDLAWHRFLTDVVSMPIKNIHFMGGETLITPRFHEFLNFMIRHNRLDLNISFVTNGTIYDDEIMHKLSMFQRVGIEVSIESLTGHNSYQRQGTNTHDVLNNITRYTTWCNNQNITLTVRPAVSALTIGYYYTLLEYCLENRLLVKALIVDTPEFLQVSVLPQSVRQQYIANYVNLIDEYQLENLDLSADFNESNPHEYKRIIKTYVDQAINLLSQPDTPNQEYLQQQLVAHCSNWDNEYGYNAIALYPELRDIFEKFGY